MKSTCSDAGLVWSDVTPSAEEPSRHLNISYPLAAVRWIVRDGEKILQQSYMTDAYNSPEIEWRDVPTENEISTTVCEQEKVKQ